jgi:hypothetical protein
VEVGDPFSVDPGVADIVELELDDELESAGGGVVVALDEGMLDVEDDVSAGGVVVDGVEVELDVLGAGDIDDEDEELDGEGVTTGGLVVDVDDGSRLHPATPMARPVQRIVTNAVFIRSPKEVDEGKARKN